jgi:proline dehydrogenase
MLRSVLLYLSEQKRLQDFVLRSTFARKRSRRFVAGETLDEAIDAVRKLNSRGMEVTLDHLGESVESEDQANKATDDYIGILDRLAAETEVKATISIKPTQIGLAIDRDLCLKNMRRLGESARAYGNFVRMDIEASCYVDGTLSIFYELEPAELAFQKKREINDNYVRLLEILMDSEAPVAIATHDDLMIDAGKRLIREHSERKAPVEFQMLYGVRRDVQARLVEEGYGMRIYVPYGNEWYPYFMRRMAERPANLIFVLRAMGGK